LPRVIRRLPTAHLTTPEGTRVPSSSKREREIARQRYERRRAREAQRRAERRRRGTIAGAVIATLLVLAGLVFAIVAVSGNDKGKQTAKPASSAAATASPSASLAPGECRYDKAASSGSKSKNVGTPPTSGVDHTTPYVASITLSQGGKTAGTVKADLLTAKAPCTVNSFRYLAGKKYFDGTECHRLTTSGIFVLQCGDPTGTGSGGPGYQFADENLTGAKYPAGTIAMANAGAGTNGSQFFVVYKDTQLPPNYTPWGKITSGLDVVTKIAAAGEDNSNGQGDGHPKQKVVITSFTVDKA
jgi:peptidyl-prolyl cis-trans isomerase B (cyclophilin B)